MAKKTNKCYIFIITLKTRILILNPISKMSFEYQYNHLHGITQKKHIHIIRE
jgi:hypothetical protein